MMPVDETGADCVVFSGAGAVVVLVVTIVLAAGFLLCWSWVAVVGLFWSGVDSRHPALTMVITTMSSARQMNLIPDFCWLFMVCPKRVVFIVLFP